MLNYKPVETPIEMNYKLAIRQDQVPTNKERYQRLVERLIYLSYTWLDIAYAVSVVCQFMHAPSERTYGNCLQNPEVSKILARKKDVILLKMVMKKLLDIQMRIGLEIGWIRNLPLVTLHLMEETWSPGEVKSKKRQLDQVRRQNFEEYHMEFVNYYG